MSAPPAGTVAQRMPMATPPGRRAMPEVPARAAGPSGMTAGTTHGGASAEAGPVAAPDAPSAPRSLPVLTVSRLAARGGRSPAADHAGHDHADHGGASRGGSASGALPVARSAASVAVPARTTVPTLGSRPLRPSVTTPRESGVPDAGSGPDAPAPAAPVAARWSAGSELPDTVSALPPAPSAGSPVPLQRLAAGSGADAAPPTRAANAPREIVFPTRDGLGAGPGPVGAPAMRAAASVQRSAAGAGPALPGFAAAPASSAGRPPSMTLHHAPAPTVTYASPAAASPVPALQRIVADPSPSSPVVQATRPAGGATLPGITATPVVQRIDGAAPDPGGAPGGHTDTELDELARALFGRIRTHLRSEVINEREAKGLSFDAF